MKLHFFRHFSIIIAVGFFATLYGCTFNYARFKMDEAVTRMFTSNQVPTDYHYYINGREDLPFAIVGITPEYELYNTLWREVTPNTDAFKRKVDFVWIPESWVKHPQGQGAWLLSPEGTIIGVFYSMYPSAVLEIRQKSGS